jgi:hypothetical protein
MDAATTAFLSSRIQRWDFREFQVPDITQREFSSFHGDDGYSKQVSY